MSVVRRAMSALFLSLALLQSPLPARETKPSLDKAIAALPASDPTPQEKRIRATPALWVAKDADTTIYLFGTLHLMTPQVDWFNGPVRRAYGDAGEVVTELGEVDQAAIAQLLIASASNKDGPPVTPDLTETQRAALTQALANADMPPVAADAFKPWFTAMVLTVAPLKKLGFDSSLGVDMTIQAQAKADGKPVVGLETPGQQFALFDSLSRPLQIQLLVATLDEADKLTTKVDAMLAAWTRGDANAIAAMLNADTTVSADLAATLLTDRNARWADWIATRMQKPGTVFMAVGAGHLAGQGSVQEALAARGIATQRVSGD